MDKIQEEKRKEYWIRKQVQKQKDNAQFKKGLAAAPWTIVSNAPKIHGGTGTTFTYPPPMSSGGFPWTTPTPLACKVCGNPIMSGMPLLGPVRLQVCEGCVKLVVDRLLRELAVSAPCKACGWHIKACECEETLVLNAMAGEAQDNANPWAW